MKKTFLLLASICLLNGTVYAQPEKKMWIGGSVGFSFENKHPLIGLHNYKIMPEWGYIFNKHWALGVRIGYTHNEFIGNYIVYPNGDLRGVEKAARNGISTGTFVRFMFLKGSLGHLFVDAELNYMFEKYTGEHYRPYLKGDSNNFHRFEVGFRPGIAVKLSPTLSLTGRFGFLGYQYQEEYFWNYKEKQKTDRLTADFSLENILLGLNVHF